MVGLSKGRWLGGCSDVAGLDVDNDFYHYATPLCSSEGITGYSDVKVYNSSRESPSVFHLNDILSDYLTNSWCLELSIGSILLYMITVIPIVSCFVLCQVVNPLQCR